MSIVTITKTGYHKTLKRQLPEGVTLESVAITQVVSEALMNKGVDLAKF